jgi:hypothetical protein
LFLFTTFIFPVLMYMFLFSMLYYICFN